MNKVYLIGNLTRDPELSTTTSGVSVCRLSIAVSRRFANADGGRDTDFFNVSAWRATAENCAKYLKKGSKIAVVGSIQTRNYEKSDGTKGFAVDIVADEVEFLSTRNDGSTESGVTTSSGAPVSDLQPVDDDSLPF
ncbi:MAG TPA: single-stranded DNA-binding protein [Candidatus Onthoplasma faecipullorum]|nr:single-stranded DNA-binding protein [Candidatus Onthoplasma faecipullorum]